MMLVDEFTSVSVVAYSDQRTVPAPLQLANERFEQGHVGCIVDIDPD